MIVIGQGVGPARGLAVVLEDAALVLEDEGGLGVVPPGEGGARVFEFAIQIVELQQQEVVLVEVQVLSWLQVDGHVVFDRQVKDVAQVIHHLLPIRVSNQQQIRVLPVLWMLIDHSKVGNIVLVVLWPIQKEDASEVDPSLEILIDLLRVVCDQLSPGEVRQALVDPLDYFLQQEPDIVHGEHIEYCAEQYPYFLCVLLPLEYLLSRGNVYYVITLLNFKEPYI